ncbi:MAG: hypothetical protein PUA51_05460 [Oscillospiraceae bacterium]|nr:hypothetical protein [Oscillospiraceae bacterium]
MKRASKIIARKVTEIKCTVLADTPNAFPVSSLRKPRYTVI